LPESVNYNEHGYEGFYRLPGRFVHIVNNELQDYILNGVYVHTMLDREGFNKFYYLQITFSQVRDIREEFTKKKFTELIIKDLQIKSESGINYSDKVWLEFPYDVFSGAEELYGRLLGFHRTDAVFDLDNEIIEVILTVEVNTEDASETKTMVYNFEPKVGGLAPPP
jgi:hypothetical protein